MLPGYLHFDVRRGLKADMLNGAMASLLKNLDCVRKTFDDVGLDEIKFSVSESAVSNVKGQLIHFYVVKSPILQKSSSELMMPRDKLSPLWHREGVIQKPANNGHFPPVKNAFLHACLNNETISLDELAKFFLNKPIKPVVTALLLKILEKLKSPVFVEQRLDGLDALWLLCHLLALVAQCDALDPKFITATKLCIGERNTPSLSTKILSLTDDLWLKQIISGLPVIEVEEIIEADVLGCAFIKVLASNFGVRGESTILEVGVGLSAAIANDRTPGFIEAIWCEAKMASSQNEAMSSDRERIVHLYEITGLVKTTSEMAHLSSMLFLHGALSPSWHLVHGEKNVSFYQMSFYCDDTDKNTAILAFLVKGNANSVVVRPVERHELHRRLVSVPIGTGNKISSVRFYEYVYLSKTVRVEPIKEDLDRYVEKTDYSVDVARGDLLSAWKKWRGREASEDA